MSDSRSPVNRLLSIRWLRWCGQYSYAAYVFHATTIELLRPAFGRWSFLAGYPPIGRALLFTLLVGIISFVAARISWEVFEKHVLALKRYFPSKGHVTFGLTQELTH